MIVHTFGNTPVLAACQQPLLPHRPRAGGQYGWPLPAKTQIHGPTGPVPVDRWLATTSERRKSTAPPALCRWANDWPPWAVLHPTLSFAPPAQGRRGRQSWLVLSVVVNQLLHRRRVGGGFAMERKPDTAITSSLFTLAKSRIRVRTVGDMLRAAQDCQEAILPVSRLSAHCYIRGFSRKSLNALSKDYTCSATQPIFRTVMPRRANVARLVV